jgi:hypothetical protein
MANGGCDLRLAVEALDGTLGLRTSHVEQLDRDLLLERNVLGTPDRTHSAYSKRMNQTILTADHISGSRHPSFSPPC